VRAGLHTGEVERRADDVAGIGVHIGARVSALAGPGEVLVTSTVKDLVIGSELEFDDRGTRTLKGVPGDWHLWAANEQVATLSLPRPPRTHAATAQNKNTNPRSARRGCDNTRKSRARLHLDDEQARHFCVVVILCDDRDPE
jgi:hypothetical protein